MFAATLFKSQDMEHPKGLLTDEWENKIHTQTKEHYSSLKKKAILSF